MRLLLAFALFLSAPALAQTSFGVRGGLNVTSMSGFPTTAGSIDETPRLGPTATAFVRVPVASSISIQPEVGYAPRGVRVDYGEVPLEEGGENAEVSERLEVDYVDVGLLARFAVPLAETLDASLLAGPVFSYKVGESVTREVDGVESELDFGADFFLPSDLGLAIGVDIGSGPVFVDLRAVVGLTNVYNGDDLNPTGGIRAFDLKHTATAFTFGYRFGS